MRHACQILHKIKALARLGIMFVLGRDHLARGELTESNKGSPGHGVPRAEDMTTRPSRISQLLQDIDLDNDLRDLLKGLSEVSPPTL